MSCTERFIAQYVVNKCLCLLYVFNYNCFVMPFANTSADDLKWIIYCVLLFFIAIAQYIITGHVSSGTSRACLPASSSYYLRYGAEGVWEAGPGGNSRGSKHCAIWTQGPRGVERWGGGAWGYGTVYSSYVCGLKAKMKASAVLIYVHINILHLKDSHAVQNSMAWNFVEMRMDSDHNLRWL